MAGKVNIFLRQLMSFASLVPDVTLGLILPGGKSLHGSSFCGPTKSAFATAISLWNERVQDRITRIFTDIRGDNL